MIARLAFLPSNVFWGCPEWRGSRGQPLMIGYGMNYQPALKVRGKACAQYGNPFYGGPFNDNAVKPHARRILYADGGHLTPSVNCSLLAVDDWNVPTAWSTNNGDPLRHGKAAL